MTVETMVEQMMRKLSFNEQERCSPVVTNWERSQERQLLIAALKRSTEAA